jgi:hypothetical protein
MGEVLLDRIILLGSMGVESCSCEVREVGIWDGYPRGNVAAEILLFQSLNVFFEHVYCAVRLVRLMKDCMPNGCNIVCYVSVEEMKEVRALCHRLGPATSQPIRMAIGFLPKAVTLLVHQTSSS